MSKTSMSLMGIVTMSFLLSLVGTQSAAQDSSSAPSQSAQLHYRFVDLGTLGGHNSGVNGGSIVVNHHNVVVGGADTAEPCPYAPDLPISPGFKWANGIKTPLPLLPGGCSAFPIAISDHGLIVGVADNGVVDPLTGSPQIHAVAWRDGGISDLGTFGGGNSLAGSVNERGQIVGVAQNAELDPFDFGQSFLGLPTSTEWRGFLWQDGVLRDLGTLGGSNAAATGDLALNESGDIAGFSFTSDVINDTTGFPTLDSFLWRNGKLHDLGTLGGTITQSFTINSKSQIVGAGLVAGDAIYHAFLWERGHIRDLGSLGGSFAGAGWINDLGEAAGAAFLTGDESLTGVIWQHGAMRQLGTLDGDDCSDAFVINSRSQVVGHSFPCDAQQEDRGYVWQNGVMTDLNDFVPPSSQIVIGAAGYISDNGIIAAAGSLPNGDTRAIVLIPCSDGEQNCRAPHHHAPVRMQLPPRQVATRTGASTAKDRVREFLEQRQSALHRYMRR